MTNFNQNTELLLLQIQNLISEQFEVLGNFLADLLLILEMQATQNRETSDIEATNNLMNCYAENLDELLFIHKTHLLDEIRKSVSLLLTGLEQLNILRVKHSTNL